MMKKVVDVIFGMYSMFTAFALLCYFEPRFIEVCSQNLMRYL